MSHWVNNTISGAYEAYRPQYNTQLFQEILKFVSPLQNSVRGATRKRRMIDIGCGTGQALRGLHHAFDECVGIDPSASQIKSAAKLPNVRYGVGKGEDFQIPSSNSLTRKNDNEEWKNSVQLITVAQAMHWFDIPKFLKHIDFFLEPNGILAVWLYKTARLSPSGCNQLLQESDSFLMANGYWPRERKHVDDGYRNLLPQITGEHITTKNHENHNMTTGDDVPRYPLIHHGSGPKISMTMKSVPLEHFINYLSTQSGLQKYTERTKDKEYLKRLEAKMRNSNNNVSSSSSGSSGAKPEEEITHVDQYVPVELFVFRKPPLVSSSGGFQARSKL